MRGRWPRLGGWEDIRHVAHRGGGRLAPENTLAGLRVAAAHGFRAVEFDVMLSADGTPFLIHDETLERTTSGAGAVANASDAKLATLFANRGFEAAFPDARIARLHEAIALCRELRLAMNIELKPATGYEAETARVVAAVLAGSAGKNGYDAPPPLISSFSPEALQVARERLPDLPFALLVGQVPGDWQQRMQELGCSALHVAAAQSDWTWLAAARAAAVPVRCYTVNRPALARTLFARGVDAIFTDALDLFAGDAVTATTGYKR